MYEHLKTTDREKAARLLLTCLDSCDEVMAMVKNLDGVYSIEVSSITRRCADGDYVMAYDATSKPTQI
jgi:hypothetical protein